MKVLRVQVLCACFSAVWVVGGSVRMVCVRASVCAVCCVCAQVQRVRAVWCACVPAVGRVGVFARVTGNH